MIFSDENINLLFLTSITILVFILYLFLFLEKEYSDEYFNNIIKNWSKSPITEISLINPNENKDNSTNAILGYYKKKESNKKVKYIIPYIWKNKIIKIKRTESEYNYTYLYNYNKGEERKKCGKDSLGNYLYFPKEKQCPINLITRRKDNKYNYKEIFFGKLIFYYTNECIECPIIMDFKVSIKEGPSYNEYDGKDICSQIFCEPLFDNNIHDLSYIKIDLWDRTSFLKENKLIDDSDFFDFDNESFYLHVRNYVGVYDNETLSYRNNFILYKMLNIKNYSNTKNLICLFILPFICFLQFFIMKLKVFSNKETKKRNSRIYLILNFLVFLLFIALILYEGYFIHFFFKMRKEVILNMNSPIVNQYHKITNLTLINICIEITLLLNLLFVFINFVEFIRIHWQYFSFNFSIFSLFSVSKYEKTDEVIKIKKDKLKLLDKKIEKDKKNMEKKLLEEQQNISILSQEDNNLNKKLNLLTDLEEPINLNKQLKKDYEKEKVIKKEYEKYNERLSNDNIENLDDYEKLIAKKENIEEEVNELKEKVQKKEKESINKESKEIKELKKNINNLIEKIEIKKGKK